MVRLRKLLDSGCDVTFQPGDGTAADESRSYECYVTTPEGNGVTACGPTPQNALLSVSRLEGDGRQVTYAQAAGGGWFADLRDEDGRSVETGIGRTHAEALAHLRERVQLAGQDAPAPSFTVAERLASLESWAEAVTARLGAPLQSGGPNAAAATGQ